MAAEVKIPCIGEEFLILSDLRELSTCGPCGPCFVYQYELVNHLTALVNECSLYFIDLHFPTC